MLKGIFNCAPLLTLANFGLAYWSYDIGDPMWVTALFCFAGACGILWTFSQVCEEVEGKNLAARRQEELHQAQVEAIRSPGKSEEGTE